jgi:uroporphyrinogen decarboxylase
MSSDLENFRATVEHRRPGRILYEATFTPDLQRRVIEHIGTDDISGHYGMMQRVFVESKRPADQEAPDYSRYWSDEDLPEGTTITETGVVKLPAGFYHFFKILSPLRNAASLQEIENYPLDDAVGWQATHTPEQIDEIHADDKIAVSVGYHMYEEAWQIRGLEQFLMDMIERPAWAQCLLDRLAKRNRNRAAAAARAGVDYILCGDDIANQNAMMFAPETWRTMMLSRWAKIWDHAKSINHNVKVFYHSDGNILPVVGDLFDAGVDILNPLQPECLDVDEVHRRYGGRLCMYGCIGTQSTMPFGTPADVRRRVKEVIDKYGRNGGLIVAPTHVLEPEVSLANIDALCEACAEYGTFE